MAKAFNLQKFEQVDGALSALRYAGDFMTCGDPRAWIRKSNILFDACIDAGMSRDEPNHEEWAAGYVIHALLAA